MQAWVSRSAPGVFALWRPTLGNPSGRELGREALWPHPHPSLLPPSAASHLPVLPPFSAQQWEGGTGAVAGPAPGRRCGKGRELSPRRRVCTQLLSCLHSWGSPADARCGLMATAILQVGSGGPERRSSSPRLPNTSTKIHVHHPAPACSSASRPGPLNACPGDQRGVFSTEQPHAPASPAPECSSSPFLGSLVC